MFEIITRPAIKEVETIQIAFKKKKELEKFIASQIRKFEDETGLAIDMIKYQRDITLPIKSPHYTDLTIIISSEDI